MVVGSGNECGGAVTKSLRIFERVKNKAFGLKRGMA
jgi:hypothetical protein